MADETWLSWEGGTFVMSGIRLFQVTSDGRRVEISDRSREDNILENASVMWTEEAEAGGIG